jgi:arabinofuranosyltransferase
LREQGLVHDMEPREPPEGPRARTWLPAAGFALVPYLWLVWRFDWLCDDAFISFRYSRHLAEGHGLVFNLGESPRVEGYSNFLWVVAMAPFEALGLDIALAARLVSIACGILLLALVARTAQRELGLGAWATSATALFFACLPSVSVWSTSGLETMPFALALFGVFERTSPHAEREGRASRGIGAGLWAVLAALLRADGALWAGALLAINALVPSKPGLRERLKAALGPLAMLALATALHVAWRLWYYGVPLPNTAYAKAGFSSLHLERGFDYVVSYALSVPISWVVPVAALLLSTRHTVIVRRAALACAFACLWAVYTGGDFMAMGRFFAPVMAFEAVLLGGTLAALAERGARGRVVAATVAAASIALALLPSFDVHPIPAALREPFHFRWGNPEKLTEYQQWVTMKQRFATWELIARALALYTRPGESIVFGAVGVVGYRTELFIFDPYGLVSPEVARLSREPARESPGHDLRVEPGFFIEHDPDYLDALIVPTGTPMNAGIDPSWRTAPWANRLQVETRALSADAGFPRGLELRLIRLQPYRFGPGARS